MTQFIPSRLKIRHLWLIVVLAVCATGMIFVLDAAAQGSEPPRLSVIYEALNLRSGPGITYSVVDVLLQGDEMAVIGRHTPSGWWQVQLDDGRTGWVSGKPIYVEVSGDTGSLPEVAAPAPPGRAPVPPGGTPAASVASTAGAQRGQAGTMVFQTVSGGPIYAINADGTNLRYLTMGIDPALSPDGRQVAFTRWEDSQHGALGSLWVINVDGSGERVILGDVHQPKSPVWSADSAKIAFNMQQGGRTEPEQKCSADLPSGPLIADEEGDYIRAVVGIDGSDVEVKFCFTLLPHPFWGLRMVDVATGAFEDLPHDLFSYAPAWDPANAWRLVYDGEQGLVNLDLNRKVTWALTADPRDHSPAFSPDGSRLAVAYQQHDHWEIHVMNADGSGRVRLTETPLRVIVDQSLKGQEPRSWNNVAPVWSPDGSQIAFLSDRSGEWQVWVMGADGSNQRPLFPPGTLDGLELQYFNVGERALSWR